MPSKYIVRSFREDSFYHIYNRGVARNKIFLDTKDYKTFLGYLKLYLTPKSDSPNLRDRILKVPPSRQLKNFSQQVVLHCYCLMPNHFHLLLEPKDSNSIPLFLKSLLTKYSMSFNKKYDRVGPVFQGKYKAVEVDSEEQLLYLSKYIHRNPFPTGSDPVGPKPYKYSSYINYLGLINQTWVKTEDILSYFKNQGEDDSYQQFVEELEDKDILIIKGKVLDL